MNQYKIKFLEDKLIDYLGFAPEAVMDHLIGTAVILQEYGASDYLVDAGLFHCAMPIGGFGAGDDARCVLTCFFS